MLAVVAQVLAEHEEAAPMIAPPIVFAGIAAAIFIVLAFVSWSFRDVANRHSDKTSGADHHQAGGHH